jgi:glycosyltransferase involved in cell wall biosynthesis
MCAASSALRDSSREVLYDGLPLPSIPSDEDRRQARLRLALPLDRLLVLFAGQIIERKGVADLLRAWVRLESEVVNRAELLIVGDDLQGNGAYRREMERLAADLMCPARFVGFQKNVADWLIGADVAVVPSHVEPLGNATLEAMALARPVVGCNVGGIPEMIVSGETGLLVPPRDPESLAASLRSMLLDPSLRRRMGEAARQRCESMFSLDPHVYAVLKEYANLLTRR